MRLTKLALAKVRPNLHINANYNLHISMISPLNAAKYRSFKQDFCLVILYKWKIFVLFMYTKYFHARAKYLKTSRKYDKILLFLIFI